MSGEQSTAEVREALEELQQYLSDYVPPLVVADSIQLLLRYSPELMAQNIHSWTAAQYRGSTEIPVSDYLFHAVKKIHLMGEFKLVPQAPFEIYLQELKEKVLIYCPEGDRAFLRENLSRLKESAGSQGPASVDAIFRQKSGSTARPRAGAAPGESGDDVGSLRRLSVILDRLEREMSKSAAAPREAEAPCPLPPRRSRRRRELRRPARNSNSTWNGCAKWVST